MMRALTLTLGLGLLVAGSSARALAGETSKTTSANEDAAACAEGSSGSERVFELRTYYTNEGKLDDLHRRFREHTNRLFKKHGIEIIGFWTPQDAKDGKGEKLVYLLAFPSREAATASWKAFQADPEWRKARDESHRNGVIVRKVESVFLDPTDYSPIK